MANFYGQPNILYTQRKQRRNTDINFNASYRILLDYNFKFSNFSRLNLKFSNRCEIVNV